MSESEKRYDKSYLLKVARLCDEEALNYTKVAQRLDIDPRKVAPLIEESLKWLLTEQQKLSVLDQFQTPQGKLEQKLCEKHPHLKKVHIEPVGKIETELQYASLIRSWAAAAAAYLDKLAYQAGQAGEELHVCMSGGETILEVMNSLPEIIRLNVWFYASAFIGRSRLVQSSHVDPTAAATVAWARSGRLKGQCIYATVSPYDLPPNISNDEIRKEIAGDLDELAARPAIKRHLTQDLDAINVAFAGLGLVRPPENATGLANRLTATTLLKTMSIKPEILAEEGAVGDFAYCLFDENGEGRDEWRFFLTMGDQSPKRRGVRFYQRMVAENKHVIVIGGTYKVPAIVAALKGKLFNVLFTDEGAAQEILAAP